jgi:hypothetical protein
MVLFFVLEPTVNYSRHAFIVRIPVNWWTTRKNVRVYLERRQKYT